MKRRRRRLAWIAIAAVVAGILPPLLTLAVTYRQAVREAEQRLASYASLIERRSDEIFGNAESTLQDLATHLDRNCTQASFETLRKAVYNSLYFREAGLIYDGSVQCTSVRVLERPVTITNPDHQVWPQDGIHITAPDLTLEQEVSIIVFHGVSGGVAVNLLLKPRQLLEPIRDAIGENNLALRIERKDGAVLARAGSAAVVDDGDSLNVSRVSQRYGFRAVVTGPRGAMLHRWWENATLFVALGLAMSLPLFLVLSHLDRRERSMDAQLRDALDNGELRVHYQPIHAAGSLRVVGAEALLRWQHPMRGMILPSVFVPMAEETGFIIPMTHWLMQRVRSDLHDVMKENPDFYIALNLSPKHFTDATLPSLIEDIFAEPFSSGRLVFKVTERELLAASNKTVHEVIRALRRSGARIALDDFGTGYSSLRYLAQFKFDLLKVDKAFIDSIGTESITAGLVNDMLAMARRLQLQVVAEGVETIEQLEYLANLGIDYVQGWYFAPAMSVDALRVYLHKHRVR